MRIIGGRSIRLLILLGRRSFECGNACDRAGFGWYSIQAYDEYDYEIQQVCIQVKLMNATWSNVRVPTIYIRKTLQRPYLMSTRTRPQISFIGLVTPAKQAREFALNWFPSLAIQSKIANRRTCAILLWPTAFELQSVWTPKAIIIIRR